MKYKFLSLLTLLFWVNVCFCQAETLNQGEKIRREKVTAGRDYLGAFAPEFAEINDDVLFGKVWSREEQLSPRDRSMITIAALMGVGITDTSMKSHLELAKKNGVTKEELVEIVTQLAFYTGWPRAWSVFAMAKDIYEE